MTDQTTAAPSGASAYREAAVEIEDLLRQLDLDGTLDPNSFEIVLPGSYSTRRYRGHTRTLRLARTALRDLQRRVDATRSALAVQGPTDVATEQISRIAKLTTDLLAADQAFDTDASLLDLDGLAPSALAAVLRAGLASVVGDASAVSIEAEPDAEPDAEPARAEVSGPSVRASVQFSADGRRLTVSAEGIYERSQIRLVPPGTVLEPAADQPVLEIGYPASPTEHDIDGDLIPDAELPGYARRLSASLAECQREVKAWHEMARPKPGAKSMSVYGELALGNPVHAAVARVLAGADGAVSDAEDLVRAIAVAALDEAADHLRSVLRQPRVTPLLVIDPDHTVWTEDSVVGMADRYRRTVADSAADELRILSRLDSPRP